MLSPEEIEMVRSLPVWRARAALTPTIPHELRASDDYVSNFDPARLGNLRTPTLLLVGGDSSALEKAAAEALDAALPDSQIVVMPHQAHLAHGTAPGVFVREVVQFLNAGIAPESASGASREGGTEEETSQTETS
jgi:pimeloyl-ACP methyl ester carboxylesterase